MTARGIEPGLVLGAVVVGIAFGERAGPGPARAALVLATAAAVAAVCVRGRLGLVLLVLASVCAGGAVTSRALDGLVHSPLAWSIARRDGATIDVTLIDDPDATRFSSRALARVSRVHPDDGGRVDAGGRTVAIDASADAASRLAVLGAGDRVQLTGYFRPLDDYEARLRWRHAVGAFSADDLIAFRGPRSPVMMIANELRGRVLAGHSRVPEPQRALIAGFLLGATNDLPDAVVTDFRAAGLSHLVAVSGENVAFVLVLVGPVLRRLPRVGRLAAGLAVLVVFGTMTRWEPSVLRACAMAACSMLAISLGRPTAGLRALALAVTVLLLADPFLVHSVGFLLSCAASVGIAVLGPPISARVPGPVWLRESLGVTVGAQLAVAPVLVAVFDGVPLVAVPANLFAAPLVGPLTISGLVSGIVGGLAGADVVTAVAVFPAYLLASGVMLIARFAARVPLMVDGWGLAAGATVLVGTFAHQAVGRATWRRAPASATVAARAAAVGAKSRVAVPPR